MPIVLSMINVKVNSFTTVFEFLIIGPGLAPEMPLGPALAVGAALPGAFLEPNYAKLFLSNTKTVELRLKVRADKLGVRAAYWP